MFRRGDDFTAKPELTNGLELGGESNLVFFTKDRYGNISEDDFITNSNHKSVYIDFGVPNLEVQNLNFGVDFSIENAATPKSDVFNTGVVISSETIDQFELRFSSNGCRHDSPSLEDGIDPELRGKAFIATLFPRMTMKLKKIPWFPALLKRS